jgi:hypothetical protein
MLNPALAVEARQRFVIWVIVLRGATDFDAGYDVRFYSAHKVHLDPIVPVFVVALFHVEPAYIGGSRKA